MINRKEARLALLTGEIGAGKTTAAGRCIELARARGYNCAGIWAPARVVAGQKTGIEAVNLGSGERRLLARRREKKRGRPLGRYTFDPAVLAWANEALKAAIAVPPDLLVVDEIGPLELEQGGGLAPVLGPLAEGRLPRALIVVRSRMLKTLRARLSALPTAVFSLNAETRDSAPEQIVEWLFKFVAE